MDTMKTPLSVLWTVHHHSTNHRGALQKDGAALCFCCESAFLFSQIKEWIDKNQTALCPKCGIDAVVPRSALPQDPTAAAQVMVDMKDHWFGGGRRFSMKNGIARQVTTVEIHEETGLDLDTLQHTAHAMSAEKGFWDEDANVGEKLALIQSEISEALEEYRKDKNLAKVYLVDGKPEGFGVELADAVIRITDLAEKSGISLSSLIRLKMRFNATRPHKHGKNC